MGFRIHTFKSQSFLGRFHCVLSHVLLQVTQSHVYQQQIHDFVPFGQVNFCEQLSLSFGDVAEETDAAGVQLMGITPLIL